MRIHETSEGCGTIGVLGRWSANEEVIGFDVAVDQILLVYYLHTRNLRILFSEARLKLRAGNAPSAVLPCTPS